MPNVQLILSTRAARHFADPRAWERSLCLKPCHLVRNVGPEWRVTQRYRIPYEFAYATSA
jgi:hypothetical protein